MGVGVVQDRASLATWWPWRDSAQENPELRRWDQTSRLNMGERIGDPQTNPGIPPDTFQLDLRRMVPTLQDPKDLNGDGVVAPSEAATYEFRHLTTTPEARGSPETPTRETRDVRSALGAYNKQGASAPSSRTTVDVMA